MGKGENEMVQLENGAGPEPEVFLAWKDIAPNTEEWHKQALQYLTDIWPRISTREAANDTWGDEVECQIVSFDHQDHKATLSLKQNELLGQLPDNGMFHPEFAKYMIETTPLKPFNGSLESLLKVEHDLQRRRYKIEEQLAEYEKLITLSVFPMLGTEPLISTNGSEQPNTNLDDVISDGPYNLAKSNIQARSNHEPDIRVPVFRDIRTKLPDFLHLNHILFGPGGCGLQATFQCCNLQEARILHDQLVVLGPIFLALTAATPVYQGVLVDTDVRWNQTASAVDDRNEHELTQVAERWSTAPMFLRENSGIVKEKPDSKMQGRLEDGTEFLTSNGMDTVMASYFAHLHLRDPLYLSAKAGKHDEVTAEAVHRSIFASVWSHVRLKLPEPDLPDVGWRVEFRPMEVQLTDYDNAAILVFLNLVRQVLSKSELQLELWMPLDLVRENMDRAHVRNAATAEQFWFPCCGEPIEMSLDQIFHGDDGLGFPGLMRLVKELLASMPNNLESKSAQDQIQPYLDMVSQRARGTALTPAQWIRRFFSGHTSYRHDSVVSDQMCYDMIEAIVRMNEA